LKRAGWARRIALRFSLRFGNGDLDWFDNLTREQQAELLALDRIDREGKQ
jgi:hypothetical protein